MELYYMDIRELPDDGLALWKPIIGSERFAQLERMKAVADQKRGLAGELLLRAAYQRMRYQNVPCQKVCAVDSIPRARAVVMDSFGKCEDIEITADLPQRVYTEKGKPYFANNGLPDFNISHSGDYAVCAFSENGGAVGVDIQQIRPLTEAFALRFFSEKEQQYLKQQCKEYEEEHTGRIIAEIFSKKESLGKYRGIGLSAEAAELDTVTCEEYIRRIELPEAPEYILTCCTRDACQVDLLKVKLI